MDRFIIKFGEWENVLFHIDPAHNLFLGKSVSPNDIPENLFRTRKISIRTL